MVRHGKTPGEYDIRLRSSPGLAEIGVFPAGRGKPLPYGGGDCEVAQSCVKRGPCCAARRGRRALQRGWFGFARRAASVPCCCTERRGRRSLPSGCGFAAGVIKPLPCAAGRRDAGPYRRRRGFFRPVCFTIPIDTGKQRFVGNVVQPVAGSAAGAKRHAPHPANSQPFHCRGRRPDAPAAAPKTSTTSGEFAASQCRARRPGAPRSSTRDKHHVRRIRSISM